MSTVIKSAETERRMRLERSAAHDAIIVSLDDGHLRPDTRFMVEIRLSRADFLAAVETELGVIVIDRADLPEVTLHTDALGRGYVQAGEWTWWADRRDSSTSREAVLAQIAAVAHLDARPPVDPAQVEALADLLRKVDPEPSWVASARRLLATGRIEVKP